MKVLLLVGTIGYASLWDLMVAAASYTFARKNKTCLQHIFRPVEQEIVPSAGKHFWVSVLETSKTANL